MLTKEVMGVADTGPERAALVTRLHRIEGQVRGIAHMVEDGTYCLDVLTQVAAASRALQSVGLLVVDQHLRHCLATAVRSGDPVREEAVREAFDAIARLVRS